MFAEFGLTKETLKGLTDNKFLIPTKVQKETLPFSLAQKDVLAQAKTGSGKTLAFLIPVLERLHRLDWNREDGLGALVISPTRELALQIFNVLRKVGKEHSFSAGLLIGGKDLKQEQERVMKMNILIATPGRLLQHMDQTPEFDCNNLQILVLDEADRILDSGFEKTLNAIVENLPKQRQTLLFSATQTKAVKDLARLSIKDAEYVAVDEHSKSRTPKKLAQKYLVCPLPSKLDILFSFIRSHLKQKTLVFLSSCKQVRFVFETFCKMQPGIPLLHLHGKQNQQKRMAIFEQFSRRPEGVLFCTDVAARGLDIPAVDWVLQVDCPDDADSYIHRVGRTARNDASGQALLLLLPSEINFIKHLEAKNIPIDEIKANPAKQQSVQSKLASICSQSPDMKYLAQKSFICYMRSIYLQKDKEVFDVQALPAEEFAESLGLIGAPKIKFKGASGDKNKSRQMAALDNKPVLSKKKIAEKLAEKELSDSEEVTTSKKTRTRIDKLFAQKNLTVLSEHYQKLKEDSEISDDEFLQISRKNHDISSDEEQPIIELSKTKQKKISKIKKEIAKLGRGNKLIFDEDGSAVPAMKMETLAEFSKQDISAKRQDFLEKGLTKLKQVDIIDKESEKQRRREIKLLRKQKEKQKNIPNVKEGFEGGVTLATYDEENEPETREDSSSSSSESSSDSDDSIPDNESLSNRKRKADHQENFARKKITEKLGQSELEAMALQLLGN